MLVAAGGDRNIRGEEGLGMGKGIGTVLLFFFVVNTFGFFVNNYYDGYSRAELGSREAAVSITRLAASSKAGVSLFLWHPE